MERAAAAINDAGVDVTNENSNSGGDGGGAGIDVDGADAGVLASASALFFSSPSHLQGALAECDSISLYGNPCDDAPLCKALAERQKR